MQTTLNTIKPLPSKFFLFLLIFQVFIASSCRKHDPSQGWTTYRYDSRRSAVTTALLPSQMEMKWNYIPAHLPQPVWDLPAEEMKRTHADDTYYVSAANGLAYYGSSVDNKVYALDLSSGREKWSFFTEGPVRFSPSVWKNRVYFGSDDGYVYCLNAKSGKLIWKYTPAPKNMKILGNGRFVSPWPIRTSVLVIDETVYFGAGVFPYDGLYVCALDAARGSVIWKNDDLDDDVFDLRYGGVSPQGYLIATETKLLIPSGRAMPAVFDRSNGEFLYYLSPSGKHGGTWGIIDQGELIAGTDRSGIPVKVAYDIETGSLIGDVYASFTGLDMAVTDSVSYVVTTDGVYAIDRFGYPVIQQHIDSLRKEQANVLASFRPRGFDLASIDRRTLENKLNELSDALSKLTEEEKALQLQTSRWFYPSDMLHSIVLTGNQVIAGGRDIVAGLDRETGEFLWHGEVEGNANGLAVSGRNLLVSTDKGNIYCFSGTHGSETTKEPVIFQKPVLPESPYPESSRYENFASAAETILEESGITKGYCLVLGCGEGELVYELARRSDLKVIGIDKNKNKIQKAKNMLDKAGLYGPQVIVENWPVSALPEYFADLIVSAEIIESGRWDYAAEEIFRVLRPGGGMAYVGVFSDFKDAVKHFDLRTMVEEWNSLDITVPEIITTDGNRMKLTRLPLAGAGGWTHQYGDPANTSCSDDKLVMAPFSTLWYGSPGPQNIPERHARSTAPVAFEGKLIVQGEDIIMAYNAYNGVLMWEREIKGSTRVRVDADGGNMAINHHGLFLAIDDKCLQLDTESGETIKTYYLPDDWKGKSRRWGYIAVKGNILFGSAAMLLKQDYAQVMGSIFDQDENWKEREELSSFDALIADYYRYSVSENMEEVEHAFHRDGTKWRFIADFPAWSPGIAGVNPVSERMMSGDGVFAYNIESGNLLWKHKGEKIAQITISVGDDAVYFADAGVSYSNRQKGTNERQNNIKKGVWEKFDNDLSSADADVRMVYSLDVLTGRKNWERPVDMSGCGDDYTASGFRNGVLVFFGSYGLHDKWRFPAGQLRWHRITALSSKDGEMMWSRPLNYMVRPLLIKDEIIIEPRKCDLYTGEIITRIHPVTGQKVPWEFYRPGHTCAATSGNEHCLFYRSYNGAYYDLKEDKGLTYYGAIRPGCWINMIPGNGLVLFPEASSGCTCSFPIRTSVVLKPESSEEVEEWSLYISNAPLTPVSHLAINLGAPGDRKDKTGTIWLGYPRPALRSAGLKFSINESIMEGKGFYSYDSKGVEIAGTESPWIFTNGCVGLQKCEIPLIDDIFGEEPGTYTVRLGFTAPSNRTVFDISLQGKTVLEKFDVLKEAGAANRAVIKEFKGIPVSGHLTLELIPAATGSGKVNFPVLNCIEILREDIPEVNDYFSGGRQLSFKESSELMAVAKGHLDKGNVDAALDAYYKVINISGVREHKLEAFKHVELVPVKRSLPVIKNFILTLDPIMWNYNEPDEEMRDAALDVFVAVANSLNYENRELATKMLNLVPDLTKK